MQEKLLIIFSDIKTPETCDDCNGMFPMSALLTHAELTKKRSSVTNVGEARRANRRMRYGNLTLFPRVERAESLVAQSAIEEEPRVIASISNVSSSGVGLIVNEELPAGLEFDVNWQHGEFPVPLTFEVVHSRPVSAGMYRTGARLIAGVLPEEESPTEFVSMEIPGDADEDTVDMSMPLEPAPLQTASGILKFEPQTFAPSEAQKTPAPAGTFKASAAFGFDKTEHLQGVTTCGWERSITVRRDGDRLWIYIHSPGKKNGWGIYVSPDQFEAALARVQRAAESPFISSMAA